MYFPVSAEFLFRVWVYPHDPSEIEVWWHGLITEDCDNGEWARESLSNYDFYDLFLLDKDKSWQVVGKVKISGSFDFIGEYDEKLDILEFEKMEIPVCISIIEDAMDLYRKSIN